MKHERAGRPTSSSRLTVDRLLVLVHVFRQARAAAHHGCSADCRPPPIDRFVGVPQRSLKRPSRSLKFVSPFRCPPLFFYKFYTWQMCVLHLVFFELHFVF